MSASDDARYPYLEIVLRLARLLEGRRYRPSASHLAETLGVSRRTVIRYLSVLRRAGWAVPPLKPVGEVDGTSQEAPR